MKYSSHSRVSSDESYSIPSSTVSQATIDNLFMPRILGKHGKSQGDKTCPKVYKMKCCMYCRNLPRKIGG